MVRHAIVVGAAVVGAVVAGLAFACPPGSMPGSELTEALCTGNENAVTGCCLDGCRVEGCEEVRDDGTRVPVGHRIERFSDGARYAEGDYRHGLRSGAWSGWYRDGRPRFAGRYQDGDRVGGWVYWYPNGVRHVEGRYRSDHRDGPWRSWDTTGELVTSGRYDLGLQVGTWTRRNPDTGHLTSITDIKTQMTYASCGPQRVGGVTRLPPIPTLTWLGIEGAAPALNARMQIANPDKDVMTCVDDFDGVPIHRIERWTGRRWEEPQREGGCGNGIGATLLPPGASVTFLVPLGDDPRPFRVSVYPTRSEPSARRVAVESTKITIDPR